MELSLLTVVFYVVIVTITHIKNDTLCHQDIEYAEWTKPAVHATLGGFAFSCVVQIRRLFFESDYNGTGSLQITSSTLLINILGGLAIAMQQIIPNQCEDSFG